MNESSRKAKAKSMRAVTAPRSAGDASIRRVVGHVTAVVLSAGIVVSAVSLLRSSPGTASPPETNGAAGLPDGTASLKDFRLTVVNATPAAGPTPAGMVWIPGGEFSMGAQDMPHMNDIGMQATTDARPVHRVYVDGFLMDQTDVTNDEFAAFVTATGYVTVAERQPRAQDFPGAPPENLVAGSVVFSADRSACAPRRPFPVVGVRERRELASSARSRERHQRQGELSGRPCRLRRCAGVREMGGQTSADRGRVGVCGARRVDRQALRLGRRVPPRRQVDGQHLSGARSRSSTRHRRGRLRRHRAGGAVSAERLRPVRHGRQRLAVDAATGIGRTTTRSSRPPAAWRAIRRGPPRSFDPAEPGEKKRCHRGGSFLCTDQYCSRYIVGTRGKGEVSTGTNHLGFRCVKSGPSKMGD